MKPVRLAIATVAAVAMVPLAANGALAAGSPANDRPSGAVPLTLGQSVSEDTSQATSGPFDAKLNQVCGAPFTNASVWYTYTADKDGSFLLDMSASNYTGGFMVFLGTPTFKSFRGCGPELIGVPAKAGKTYTIVVFSDTSVNGGDLELSLQEGPPPPTMSLTVDPNGKAFKNGDAQVSGTFTCANADFADVQGTLTQIWKRVKINGFFDKFLVGVCDGSSHAWKATVVSDNGLYAPGDATVGLFATSCGLIDCVNVNVDPQTVTLQGGGGLASPTQAAPVATVTTSSRGILTWKDSQHG